MKCIEKGSLVTYKGILYIVGRCGKDKANLKSLMGNKVIHKNVSIDKLTFNR